MVTSFEENSTIATSETSGFVSQTTVVKEKLKSYKKYTSEDLRECVQSVKYLAKRCYKK